MNIDQYKIKREVLDELDGVIQEATIGPKLKSLAEKKKGHIPNAGQAPEENEFNKLFGKNSIRDGN